VLRVYTRHYPPCRQTNCSYRRCRCPKWINGLLPTGRKMMNGVFRFAVLR
jgi:hypothetical protein